MKIILLGYPNRLSALETSQALRPKLEQVSDIVFSDFTATADLTDIDADAVVVLGGDGSLFRAVSQMGAKQRPIIAVNLGRLGFLADVTVDQIVPLLGQLDGKPLPVAELMMYQCRIIRDGKECKVIQGVNETAILNGAPFAIMEVKLHVDNELVTTYSCDGLIISTPVGSTAHSLSAGGPILHKTMQAFVVCPIAAHTLSNRPVVDDASRVFLMEVINPTPETCVVTDGQVFFNLERGDKVEVRKSDLSVQLIVPPNRNYYQTLREKLGWSGQPIYRR